MNRLGIGGNIMSVWTGRLVVFAVLALGGCSSIDAEGIQRFGQATQAVADATRNAGQINQMLDDRILQVEQASLFAGGGVDYAFPPPKSKAQQANQEWNQRVAFAQALSDYGAALAKAAAGVKGDDLDGAVDNLQKAVTTVAPKLAERKNFEPVSATIESAAKRAITEIEYRRIQRIIANAHPAIVQGRDLLAKDFALMADDIRNRYRNWIIQQGGALRTIHEGAGAGEKYRAYQDFLAERRQMAEAVAFFVPQDDNAPPAYLALLDKLVAAHKQLAEGTPDSAALSNFIAAAADFQSAFKLISSAGG